MSSPVRETHCAIQCVRSLLQPWYRVPWRRVPFSADTYAKLGVVFCHEVAEVADLSPAAKSWVQDVRREMGDECFDAVARLEADERQKLVAGMYLEAKRHELRWSMRRAVGLRAWLFPEY